MGRDYQCKHLIAETYQPGTGEILLKAHLGRGAPGFFS